MMSMYSLDDLEYAFLLIGGAAEATERQRMERGKEREWLRASLRRDFDKQTLAWLEPLVMQRWMRLRGDPPKGFDTLGTFHM